MHLITFVDLDITVAKTQVGLSGSLYVSLGGTKKEAHKEKRKQVPVILLGVMG